MEGPDEAAGPINLGNPTEISIRVLAELVIDLTGSKSIVVTRPLPEDDPIQRCPEITRARKLLGWEPRVPLEEGLMKTITYFSGLLEGGLPISHKN